MSCCCDKPPDPPEGSGDCCGGKKGRPDFLLWGSLAVVAAAFIFHFAAGERLAGRFAGTFAHSVVELMTRMWWGLLFGILAMALLSKVPREFVMSALGTKRGLPGLLRAAGAGLMLDLCNHGILMVGAKLYERGASYGQLLTFLIASPWNSFSLTLVLVALIGLPWTLAFVALSLLIALVSGTIADVLTERGKIPANPNRTALPEDFRFVPEARRRLSEVKFNAPFVLDALKTGISESRMVVRWIMFGVLLASLIRVLVNDNTFVTWFGPSVVGLLLTLLAATVIEVCSEGSSPIAADLFTRGGAPGNSFTFLMAGAATDYTELMVLRETTRRWTMALFLPAVTVPQVLVIGWLLNQTVA